MVAFDGKTLRSSFDSFSDIKARQPLGAFAVDTGLVLPHVEIDEKSNEIPAIPVAFIANRGLAKHPCRPSFQAILPNAIPPLARAPLLIARPEWGIGAPKSALGFPRQQISG